MEIIGYGGRGHAYRIRQDFSSGAAGLGDGGVGCAAPDDADAVVVLGVDVGVEGRGV